MFPSVELLKKCLQTIITCKAAQGHEVEGLQLELRDLPASYDAIHKFGEKLRNLPIRADWKYIEPNDHEAIVAECDKQRPSGQIGQISLAEAAGRAQAAFEGAIAGCILGKPLEINPTLEEIRKACESVGEWPMNDYVSVSMLEKLGRRHPSWETCCRDRIKFVSPDDDINYTIMGMMMLQRFGIGFTKLQLADVWLHNLPPLCTWGPERMLLSKAGIQGCLEWPLKDDEFENWAATWNPNDEACGAAIRVDAYGYACPGRPALAAELAWRDSSWTHKRTGIYGAMFIAAAIAAAFVERDRLKIFEIALACVPKRSRFYEITKDCLEMVRTAGDWLDGYGKIHAKYSQYGHCQIYQEVGTMINTAKFAASVDEAICMQVSQGCDTDCFGEIIGSIMGAYFGPGCLSRRWMEPFSDVLYTSLANFHEQSLGAVTCMMGRLPEITLK